MKALAKKLRIPVVLLSQLNRQVELRPDRRPVLADLRDSGAIEQDADVVMLLWQLSSPHIGVNVAKNRTGPTGTFVLDFDRPRHVWVESTARLNDPGVTARGHDADEL